MMLRCTSLLPPAMELARKLTVRQPLRPTGTAADVRSGVIAHRHTYR